MGIHKTIAVLLTAIAVTPFGRAEGDDLPKLIERANTAPMNEQPRLGMDIAEREVELADKFYSTDQLQKARSAVGNVIIFADKATDAAIQTGKRLKDTEIALRKMSLKLRDMKRKLSIDDQGPVQDASDHLEALRSSLLAHMFKKKK